MSPIPISLADAIRAYVAARRASTSAWGRGLRGKAWLRHVADERTALAVLADAALDWDTSERQPVRCEEAPR